MAELSLWDRFKIAITPESTGEAHVRENFYRESIGVRTNWSNYPTNDLVPRIVTDPVGPIDKFLIAIAPQSSGEALVESMYSPENRGNWDNYPYDPDMDWTTPDIIHTAGLKVQRAINTVKSGLGVTADYLKYTFIGIVVIVLLYFGLQLFLSRR